MFGEIIVDVRERVAVRSGDSVEEVSVSVFSRVCRWRKGMWCGAQPRLGRGGVSQCVLEITGGVKERAWQCFDEQINGVSVSRGMEGVVVRHGVLCCRFCVSTVA